MKPWMKFFGNAAFGSSSALKYLSTCVSCFQKLSVSCPMHQRNSCLTTYVLLVLSTLHMRGTYLKFLVTVEKQHVRRLQLRHISMPLELLSHLRAEGRHGHVERVHCLDFWCLCAMPISILSSQQRLVFCCALSCPRFSSLTYRSDPISVARQHSRLRFGPVLCCVSVSTCGPASYRGSRGLRVQERVLWARYVGLITMLAVVAWQSSPNASAWSR